MYRVKLARLWGISPADVRHLTRGEMDAMNRVIRAEQRRRKTEED